MQNGGPVILTKPPFRVFIPTLLQCSPEDVYKRQDKIEALSWADQQNQQPAGDGPNEGAEKGNDIGYPDDNCQKHRIRKLKQGEANQA